MAFRSLLVPMNGGPDDILGLETALALGQGYCAHIAAVSVNPDPVDIIRYNADWCMPILTDTAVESMERRFTEQVEAASATFQSWRQRNHLHLADAPTAQTGISTSWRSVVGATEIALADIARFADLVVMRGLGQERPFEDDAMLDAVVFDAGRPVLLIPRRPLGVLSGVALIAWDGARESLHAITSALPLLNRMGTVRVLTVDDDGGARPEDLASYLRWHGITAETKAISRNGSSVGEILIRETDAIGAGLIVMGGYHHSRMREIVFGGTTQYVIAHAKIPVLMAH